MLLTSKVRPFVKIKRIGNQIALTSKVTGRIHIIPTLFQEKKAPVEHRIKEHIEKMECSSCHARWSFQDFGFHLLRDDHANYSIWERLTFQNDPQIQKLLKENLSKPANKWNAPTSKDWLSNQEYLGAWYEGYSYRRWEDRILGINSRGKTSIFRPQYQFVISYVNAEKKVVIDSQIPRRGDGQLGWAMNPYSPHTIRREVGSCEICHLHPRALGLGDGIFRISKGSPYRPEIDPQVFAPLTFPFRDGVKINFQWDELCSLYGEIWQPSTHKGAQPYSPEKLLSLLIKTGPFKEHKIKHLREKNLLLYEIEKREKREE